MLEGTMKLILSFSKTKTPTNMGSAPNISGPTKNPSNVLPSLKQSITYRNSASDIRRVQEDAQQIRRSISLGKDVGKGLKVDRSISEKFGVRPRASSISLLKKVNPLGEKPGQRKTLGENVNNVSFSGKSSSLVSIRSIVLCKVFILFVLMEFETKSETSVKLFLFNLKKFSS